MLSARCVTDPESRRKDVRDRLVDYFGTVNPRDIKGEDVSVIYAMYNERFFENTLDTSVAFAVSNKLISGAGNFVCSYKGEEVVDMKLTVSRKVILSLFPDESLGTVVLMGGLRATDRVSVLQLVIEHELCHLVVMTSTEYISKRGKGKEFRPHGSVFKEVVKRYFGHVSCAHSLYPERSFTLGQRVTFGDKGEDFVGTVEKINRYTVLVDCGEFTCRVRKDVID